ncbi:putative histidine kinase-like ATPases [Trypoxylus dichotomus]
MSTFPRFSRLLRLSQTAAYGSKPTAIAHNVIRLQGKNLRASTVLARFQSTSAEPKEDEYHSIIKDTEKPAGETTKHEFQADTKMLLDIVARSLYSDKEVFVRELISNASDALEKFRYMLLVDNEAMQKLKDAGRKLEIHVSTNKQSRTLTIQDTGIGMTKDELITNLGVIARSGSKAFLKQLKDKHDQGDNIRNIIGQFGVGFYSAFMVAEKVEVYSKAATEEQGYRWCSDGTGSYEIQPADGVQFGTKIVIYLKVDCREFADGDTIKDIIQKYSNFVGSPIYLNGKRENIIQPLWLSDPKSITPQQHAEFYRYVSNSYDLPRYTLHYNTDVPLSIHALLYFPEGKPGLFEMSRDTTSTLALYSRKVLIKHKTDNILPKWLRFVKGVVDSEDIPLNLSRELLQNSALIRKLQNVLTRRILKFLSDEMKKKPEEYEKFYADYSLFLKEGIMMNHDQSEKVRQF